MTRILTIEPPVQHHRRRRHKVGQAFLVRRLSSARQRQLELALAGQHRESAVYAHRAEQLRRVLADM